MYDYWRLKGRSIVEISTHIQARLYYLWHLGQWVKNGLVGKHLTEFCCFWNLPIALRNYKYPFLRWLYLIRASEPNRGVTLKAIVSQKEMCNVSCEPLRNIKFLLRHFSYLPEWKIGHYKNSDWKRPHLTAKRQGLRTMYGYWRLKRRSIVEISTPIQTDFIIYGHLGTRLSSWQTPQRSRTQETWTFLDADMKQDSNYIERI